MKRTGCVLFALASMLITTDQVTTNSLAQSKCSLTETSSPAVRGIKFGMTAEQVIALFPGTPKREGTKETKETKDAKELLEKAKSQSNIEPVYLTFEPAYGLKEQFAGVASVSVGFSKGRAIDLSIQYVGPEWKNVDEWIAKLSETLGLPAGDAWQTGPSESPNKILRCTGIEIEAAIQGGGGSLRIRSNEITAAQDRTRAGEEKKKRDFKP